MEEFVATSISAARCLVTALTRRACARGSLNGKTFVYCLGTGMQIRLSAIIGKHSSRRTALNELVAGQVRPTGSLRYLRA